MVTQSAVVFCSEFLNLIMNANDLGKELASKRRNVSDLVRFISNRTDHNPNYSLLLGAGCSISSGVRSATTLSNIWREELYLSFAGSDGERAATVDEQRDYLKAHQGGWFDPTKEYSSLFEKRYDLQRQRRMFVETEVSGKTPSIGYAYLTALVNQNYVNTIFTTNFDDLLNEAFYIYSDQRPIVCAHDSSINSITVTSKRPKIIKLHGDYLFDDLKSTLLETESLEQNMRAKFSEFAKEYGLIVVGYSGSDKSIMDAISALLKNEMFLKGGIYWCIRKGSEIPDELRKLIWKDRVYFVEIDGFDEFFAEVYAKLNGGDVLPSSIFSVSHKPVDVASRLLSNRNAFPDSCDYLRAAREKLERLSKRTALANMIVKSDDDDSKFIPNAGISDDDLLLLTEIQSFIAQTHYVDAIDKIRIALLDDPKLTMKLKLLKLLVSAHKLQGEKKHALNVVEDIIALQPKRGTHHLLKASLLNNLEDQISCVQEAIEVDPYYVKAYLENSSYLMRFSETLYGQQKREAIDKARESLDMATRLNPSSNNLAWTQLFKLVSDHELDKNNKTKKLEEIIETMRKQNPFGLRTLALEEQMLNSKDEHKKFEVLLERLEQAKQRSEESLSSRFEILRAKALIKIGKLGDVKDILDQGLNDSEFCEDSYFCVEAAKILRSHFSKDALAIDLLSASLENEFNGDVFTSLMSALCENKKFELADKISGKWLHKLNPEWRSRVKQELFEAKGEYEDALKELDIREKETGRSTDSHRVYLFLKLSKYEQADKIARKLLAPINFSAEAAEIVVNFEIARKNLGAAVDTKRLEAVLRFNDSPETEAAVSALMGKKSEMITAMKKAMAEDCTFRFRANTWPVFDNQRAHKEFSDALSVERTRSYQFRRDPSNS